MRLTAENFIDMRLMPDETSTLGAFCDNNVINADTSLDDINPLLVSNGFDEITNADIAEYIIGCENAIVELTERDAGYEDGSQRIDSISLIKDVCERYNPNVVADVLANNVISREQYNEIQDVPAEKNKIINEKYLPKVKRWAFNRVNNDDFDYNLMSEPQLSNSINPTIINSLVETYIKEHEKSDKDIPLEK